MNEDFVPFELAVKLKEKGFRKPCVATYDKDGMLGYNYYQPKSIKAVSFDDCLCISDDLVLAPTISQVLKWLREKKKIFVVIAVNPTLSTKDKIAYYYQVYSNCNGVTSDYYESEYLYSQWEECAIDSIKYVL